MTDVKRDAKETIEAVKSAPLAAVILILNAGFLWFGAYILGELAANNATRDKAQFELIQKLIQTTLECRAAPVIPPMPQ